VRAAQIISLICPTYEKHNVNINVRTILEQFEDKKTKATTRLTVARAIEFVEQVRIKQARKRTNIPGDILAFRWFKTGFDLIILKMASKIENLLRLQIRIENKNRLPRISRLSNEALNRSIERRHFGDQFRESSCVDHIHITDRRRHFGQLRYMDS
jgi:hypothetical protein